MFKDEAGGFLYMKKGLTLLLAVLLCMIACCAIADDDWGKAIVDAPNGKLHLREKPTSDSDSMGLYFTGTQVSCKSDPKAEWVEVKIGRERGYMMGKYLKTGARGDRVEPRFLAGTVQATNYARLRKGPSTEYQFICKINDGKNVTVMGETDEHWYYVKYGDEKGFISKNLVYTRENVIDADEPDDWTEPQWQPVRKEGWRTAYRQWMQQNGDAYFSYDLIYVNDDDTPELVVSTGAEAGGCQILTYGGSGLQILQTRRLHFTYVRRGNLLCNADGHMDSYFDDVYAIENGRWRCIASGVSWGYFGEFSEVLGRYLCRNYQWNGKNVSIAEYLNALSQVYPSHRAEEPALQYNYAEMLSLLKE